VPDDGPLDMRSAVHRRRLTLLAVGLIFFFLAWVMSWNILYGVLFGIGAPVAVALRMVLTR